MDQKRGHTKRIPIRMFFEGEEARRFVVVKDFRGVKTNTDLIRVLISDEYIECQRLNSQSGLAATPPQPS